MKKVIYTLTLFLLPLAFSSCEVLEEAAKTIDTGSSSPAKNSLTNGEVIKGLKEALTIGIENAVSLTSVTNGFLNNPQISLPFPESANTIKEKALEWGLDGQVDKIITTLNRAAEDASKEATPIFINAIKNMSIQDGFSILNDGDGAATNFLRKNTTEELIVAFSPKVKTSIEKVKLTEYWEPVATRYNQAMLFTGGQKIEVDLNRYVTERAIDGLFDMVEKEENKIREDPKARVTDVLTKVFGSLGN